MLSPEEKYHRAYEDYCHRTKYLTDALVDIEINHFRKMVINTVTGEVSFVDNYTEEQLKLRRQVEELRRIAWTNFFDAHGLK